MRSCGLPARSATGKPRGMTALERSDPATPAHDEVRAATSTSGPELAAHLEALLVARRPAEALELVDAVADPTPYLARIWIQVGSRRALRALEGPLDPGLAAEHARFLESGPPPQPIPSGSRDELSALANELGARGLVHELAHCHLGLAELDLRVDERLAHIEAALALAQQLDDPALLSLATAYEARLNLHLGEADDARDQAELARSLGLAHQEPRAAVIAIAVIAALDGDGVALAEAVVRLQHLGFAPNAFGLGPAAEPAGPSGVGV